MSFKCNRDNLQTHQIRLTWLELKQRFDSLVMNITNSTCKSKTPALQFYECSEDSMNRGLFVSFANTVLVHRLDNKEEDTIEEVLTFCCESFKYVSPNFWSLKGGL